MFLLRSSCRTVFLQGSVTQLGQQPRVWLCLCNMCYELAPHLLLPLIDSKSLMNCFYFVFCSCRFVFEPVGNICSVFVEKLWRQTTDVLNVLLLERCLVCCYQDPVLFIFYHYLALLLSWRLCMQQHNDACCCINVDAFIFRQQRQLRTRHTLSDYEIILQLIMTYD